MARYGGYIRASSSRSAQAAVAALVACTSVNGVASHAAKPDRGAYTIHVAGSGMDWLTTAIVHSKKTTPTGLVQQSTEIVDLDGDLKGRVLYHVTSVFDFAHGTLVNTGDQVYSGTVPDQRRS